MENQPSRRQQTTVSPGGMQETPANQMGTDQEESSPFPEYETSIEGWAAAAARATYPDSFKGEEEEVLPSFCLISLEDFLIWDNWIAWEQELRCAQHEWDKLWAFLAMELLV